MRKLHIKSEDREVFLDNLKEIMISRGLSELSVDTDQFTKLFSGLNGILKEKNLLIDGYYSVENLRGVLLGTKNKRLLIICGGGVKVVSVSKGSTHFDHLRLIKTVINSPESVNFLDI